jgi:hypothetical protein
VRRNGLAKFTRMMASLLIGLSFPILALAQSVPASRSAQGFGPVYDAAHEITLNGTIQEVVIQRPPGGPPGTHVLVAGPEGLVDAHIGPFLSQKTKDALQAGTPIEIVGATTRVNEKSYLLARQLIIAGRTITVRSKHGFLLREYLARAARSKPEAKSEKTAPQGESQ